MKVVQNFNIMYILLVIAQLLICNYLHLSALVTVSILPVMTLCLPLSVKTIPALFIAFLQVSRQTPWQIPHWDSI